VIYDLDTQERTLVADVPEGTIVYFGWRPLVAPDE
jgi:hypothetical protein